jgi:hypothetical protein
VRRHELLIARHSAETLIGIQFGWPRVINSPLFVPVAPHPPPVPQGRWSAGATNNSTNLLREEVANDYDHPTLHQLNPCRSG